MTDGRHRPLQGKREGDKHGVCGTLDGTLGGTLDSKAHRLEKALVPGALSTMGRRGWSLAKQISAAAAT